jgi:hypothetical protein
MTTSWVQLKFPKPRVVRTLRLIFPVSNPTGNLSPSATRLSLRRAYRDQIQMESA